MAASGFTPISLYYSTTASAVPTSGNLANGELGLNIADMKLYAKNSAGTVTLLASSSSTGATVSSVSGTGTVNGLTLTGTVTTSGSLTLGGTLSLVSPPPIGSTTPNTGAFTTLSATGNVSTASGFGYLWGAGAVQIYSNTSYLRFRTASTDRLEIDSSGNLGLGVTPSAWNASFYKVLQVSDRGSSFASNTSSYSTAPYLFIGNNAFSDVASGAGFKYVTTNASAQYRQVNAEHQFFTAASGTAGNAITFTQAMTLDASGRLGIGTSSPATTLHLRAAVCNVRLEDADTSAYANVGVDNSGSMYLQADPANSQASTAIYFATDGTERARIDTSGNLLVGGTAARGTTAGTAHLDLFNGTAPAGTLTNGISLYSDSGDLKFMNAAGDAFDVGYRNIPQNSQSAAYTLVLADAGKHIFHPVGDNNARTFTIPANSSVAFPIGTAITFINMAAANVTIAITTDTLTLSPAGTSGSRTLAQYGSATCIKITSTQWLISGSGLT
jgi:hypothetical protein